MAELWIPFSLSSGSLVPLCCLQNVLLGLDWIVGLGVKWFVIVVSVVILLINGGSTVVAISVVISSISSSSSSISVCMKRNVILE